LTTTSIEVPDAERLPAARPRLDHVDAIRPVKQLGVVTTHSVNFLAPTTSLLAGGSLILLHVSREAFLFVSACMLTYANPDLARIAWGRFVKRRVLSIAVPYSCWTVIYWASLTTFPLTSPAAETGRLVHLFLTGYNQLYYLLVIAQFYVLFPLVLLLIRATRRHPVGLLAVSGGLQLLWTSLMHWGVTPSWMQGYWATREVTSYQFYLLGGCLAAVHLQPLERWLIGHARAVVVGTAASAVLAEVWYVLATRHTLAILGDPSDPFQPVVLPFNIGAILSLYLLGRVMVDSRRSVRFRRWVRQGSDNSYGIFLAHMLFISALVDADWRGLTAVVPWPIVVLAGAAIAYSSAWFLTSLLRRTPLAPALTGQRRYSENSNSRPRLSSGAMATAPGASPG
jgi:peptidoglycan/LPS O-acetylase OafA/YrhL